MNEPPRLARVLYAQRRGTERRVIGVDTLGRVGVWVIGGKHVDGASPGVGCEPVTDRREPDPVASGSGGDPQSTATAR